MEETLLDVRGLEAQFKTAEGTIHAVNRVSFSLKKGETMGLVGESGSGKSVTMLTVLRLLPTPPARITAGSVHFRGRDLLAMSGAEVRDVRGRQIGIVFQDPMTSLNPVLTIGRQITETLEVHMEMSHGQARERAAELLDLVGIPKARDRLRSYPHQFSGGMRQRAMIAMALACRPQILIADEPTTALDVTIQAQIVELVKRLRDELGMAVIWITHDLGIIAGLARLDWARMARQGIRWSSSAGKRLLPRPGLVRSERGQALIELAFILPIMFVFLLVLVDFGLALDRREVIQHAVREGARFGAVHPGTTDIITETVNQSEGVLNATEVSVCYDTGPNGEAAGNVGSYVRVSADYTYGFTAGSGELLATLGIGAPSINMTPAAEGRLEQPVSGATSC